MGYKMFLKIFFFENILNFFLFLTAINQNYFKINLFKKKYTQKQKSSEFQIIFFYMTSIETAAFTKFSQ